MRGANQWRTSWTAKKYHFLIYRSALENVSVNAIIKDDTIWLTQKSMTELFDVQTPAISKHLKNIFSEGELSEKVVVSKMEIPSPHGALPQKTQLHETQFYNLDAIISVGYRVNSRRATQFRIWATGILREYMLKGVVRVNHSEGSNPSFSAKSPKMPLYQRFRACSLSIGFSFTFRKMEQNGGELSSQATDKPQKLHLFYLLPYGSQLIQGITGIRCIWVHVALGCSNLAVSHYLFDYRDIDILANR